VPWQPYHTVWALVVFGWIGNYVVRMAFSPLLEPVMAEFGLSHAGAGFLFSVFFYGYMVMQIPAGFLGDRFGRKRVLVCGIVLVSGATLLTGLAPTLFVLGLSRLLSGLAQGMYFANDRPIIATVTPPHRLALGQGISFSGLGLGNALGVVAGGVLGAVLPWRAVFLVLMGLPLVAATLIGWLVPDVGRRPGAGRSPGDPVTRPLVPAEARADLPAARADTAGLRTDVSAPPSDAPARHAMAPAAGRPAAEAGPAQVFRHPDLWRLGLAGMCPIWTQFLIGTWGPAFFVELGVQEMARSALYASLLGVAAPPGLLAMGALSDGLLRRGLARKVVVGMGLLGMAVAVALMGLTVQLRGPAWLLAVLVFVTSFFLWGVWAPVYATIAELFPPRVMGVAFGFLNAISFVSAVLTPYVNGWIKDWTGSFAWGCYVAAVIALAGVPVALAVRPAFRLTAPAAGAARGPAAEGA
jgi:ACS family D-galactonate transporter-like MFS transporter